MIKKIYLFLLLLVPAIILQAQDYPKSIGYEANESVQTPGNPNMSAVSFSAGSPFATQWNPALADGTGNNYVLSGMRHNIMFFDNAFDEDLFVSKGYYGDYIELRWNLIRYASQVTGFKIYRRELGSGDDFEQVANVSSDSRNWRDEYAESGVMYEYYLKAEGIFPGEQKFLNFIEGVGFRVPYGRISGRVTYEGGGAVQGVSVIAETDDNFSGSSIYLNGTDAYLAISPDDDPIFELDTAMTFQMWVKPDGATANSVLFQKGSQYKLTYSSGNLTFTAGGQSINLTFTQKVDTFFHVTAMKTYGDGSGSDDSLKLIVLYNEQTYYIAKDEFTGTSTANTDELYIGYDGTANYFKGYVDELRIWRKSFSENDIISNAGLYIAGTEEYLSAYYRMNEGIGVHFYDLSRKGFTFNENHGYKHSTAIWSDVVPYTRQLAVKGITDVNGNYIIAGIPYATDGSTYRFVPVYGIHNFDPTEQLLFIGPGASVHSNINFTDVASFPVTGEVYYKDTYFPVEGVSIKIDGQVAVNSEGVPITTDNTGKFVIDVPIGEHFIQLAKYGHGFENNGRFPATEGDMFDFQQPYTFQSRFNDTTLIKVIGKTVGGPIQAAKPKGLGKSTNNIGNATIVMTTQKSYDLETVDDPNSFDGTWDNMMHEDEVEKDKGDTKFSAKNKQITIEPDPVTGEFVAYLLPEKYVITGITAGGYTYPDYFHKVVDLSSAYIYSTEVDSIKLMPPIITPTGDTIYDYRLDSIRYQKNLDLIYRENPTMDVTKKDGTEVFWETEIEAKDGTMVPVVDGATGDPLTDWPILLQREKYELKISVFEEYFNDDTDPSHLAPDKVPVTDGTVEIKNELATDKSTKLFQVSETGEVIYKFTGGLANTISPYTNAMSITAYTGNGGTIQTQWEYEQAVTNPYTGNFKAYLLGGLPSGNNFVTTGPSKVDMILRDPPGSNSYSYYEVASSVSKTSTSNVLNENSGSESVDFMLGGTVSTFAGLGAGVIIETSTHNNTTIGLEHRETWIDENTTTSTVTTTKRWQTSDEPDFVGSCGDIFIGHSTNIVYGKCTFIDLLKTSEGEGHIGSTVGGQYQIGKHIGVRVNPEFGTGFQYSQNHIENYLIPNLEFLRNNYLHNASDFTSIHPFGDDNYGNNNSDQDTTENGDGSILIAGDSYQYLIPASWPDDSLYVDTVRYYNQQIQGWINILKRNEKEKVKATLIENLSYDAGVIYESSETHDSTVTETSTFEWQISPSLANETGFDVSKVGMTVNIQESYNHVETQTDGTETTHSVTFGYVLNDTDEGDYFSVDVKAPPSHTGPVFKTRGGQSQCPYEDQEVTQYYQPGTVIGEAVMQREVPYISCDIPTQINVPEDQAAIFYVDLKNASETGDDAWYMISVDEASNQHGAVVRLDGNAINNGRVIFIEAETLLTKVITIEKTDPAVDTYNDIGIILHSICQFDPGDNWADLSDTVFLSANFQKVCSGVELTAPDDLWVLNTNTLPIDILGIEMSNYNLSHTGFEQIVFQYKPASTSNWISDKFFFVNEDDYNNSTETNKEWINNASSVTYNFDFSSLQDRNYHVRAMTLCSNGTTTNQSLTLTGIKDTKRPKVFGTPQPGDGILSPGDDVMITFDETIEASLLLGSNFSVRGVLNGAELRHNSSLYFDGIDDYASVIAGVNLQDKSFAVEFWTKRDELTEGVVFSQGNIEIGFNASNQLYVKMGTNSHATSHVYDFTDKWIHVTVSFDYETKTVNVYSAHDDSPAQHNSIEFENVDFSDSYVGTGRMNIGSNVDGTGFYKGFIHDFRIWEKSIGYGTANSNMLITMNGDEIGLSGMWPMDEAHGDYAQDLSRAHNAQINGAIWKVLPVGFAEVFNGTSSNIEIPTASSIIITDEMDMTIEFWFNANAGQTNTVMFSNGIGDGTDGTAAIPDIWNIGFNNTGELYAKNNGISITVDNEDFLDNQWHHFALVLKRNGNTSIYVDGNMKEYKQSTDFGGLKGANMTIGAQRHYVSGATSKFFSGSIDEFRAWKLARTSKLLNMDMSSKLAGDEKGLVAYYPFDKYDATLVLVHSLEDCDINDNTGNPTGLTATSNSTTNTQGNVPNIKDARPAQNLAFNWVVNDDKIIINLEEPAELVEKCVIEFTVDRIEDMHENRIASPATWTAYIKKNTVIWDESQLNFEKEVYAPLAFDVNVLNIGGIEQNFVISNLPSWLSVDIQEGTLAPDSYQTIHFTVDESVNIGNYDVSIYLTSDFGYSEKLSINLKVFKTPPVWEVNPDDFQYSMSVIAQLKIDGLFSTNTDDRVAAFVDGECRGVANLEYIEDYDMFEVFLNIYSNKESGDNISFKIWNASEGIIHENVEPELVFEYNSIYGTPSNPIILETSNSYTRNILLANGWKWISFNLDNPNLSDVNETFKDVSANVGDQIKGLNEFVNYGEEYGWTGSLANNGGFNLTDMYMVKLSQKDTLTIKGAKNNPLLVPITLKPGWSWIGFTPQVNIPVNEALANINPTADDLIKSQYEFAMYDPSMGWLGSLDFLQPGEGYMYFSNNGADIELLYPQSGLNKSPSNLERKDTDIDGWNLISENYQFNMSVLGEVYNPNKPVSETDIVGAFVGNECRGIARPIKIDNEILHFITIYSNTTNETINFRLIDTVTNDVSNIEEKITFIPNDVIGNSSIRQPLSIKMVTSSKETVQNKFRIYPNPTSDKVFVDLSSFEDVTGADIELTDVTGKTLIYNPFNGNQGEIDLSDFSAGVYLLKINTGNTVIIEKIILK